MWKLFVVASWNIDGAEWITSHAAEIQHNATVAFEDEAISLAGSIIANTPIFHEDGGTLKNNWQIGRKPNNRILKGKNKSKGLSFAEKKLRGKLAITTREGIKKISNKSMFIFNNSPYARVVEFGGYPNPVKRGTWVKKQSKFIKFSAGGFSKRAPQGMVRTNIIAFKNRLKRRMSRL